MGPGGPGVVYHAWMCDQNSWKFAMAWPSCPVVVMAGEGPVHSPLLHLRGVERIKPDQTPASTTHCPVIRCFDIVGS